MALQTVSKRASKGNLEERIDNYRSTFSSGEKKQETKEWNSLHRLLTKFVNTKSKSFLGIEITEALQHTVLGEQALHKGEREEAQQSFKAALECDPKFEDALIHLAFLEAHEHGEHLSTRSSKNSYRYLKKLDWERKKDFWTNGKALKYTPYRWRLLLNGLLLKADICYKLEKHAESLQSYESAWLLLKGNLRTKRNNIERAEMDKIAKKCLNGICRMQLHVRTAPENIIWFRSVLITEEKPKFSDLADSLKHCILSKYAALLLRHSSQRDYQLVRKSLKKSPDGIHEFVPENDIEDCLLLLKLHLKLAGLSLGKIARAENELCLAFSRSRHWADLAETLRNSIAISMENIPIWYKLGLSLMSSGEYPEALLALKQVGNTIIELTKLNPGRWSEMKQYQNVYLLALLLSTKVCVNYLAKTAAAVEFARKALDVVDGRGFGVKSEEKKRKEQPKVIPKITPKSSLRDIEQSIDHRATCHFSYGVACAANAYSVSSFSERKKLQKRALTSLTAALKMSKYNQNIVFNLAAAHADIREIPLGIRMVHYSLSLDRSHVSSWHLLALLLTAQKKFESAHKAIDDAISLDTQNHRLRLTKARILFKMGYWQKSVWEYQILVNRVFHPGEFRSVKYASTKKSSSKKEKDRDTTRPIFPPITDHKVAEHINDVEEDEKAAAQLLGFEFCSTDPSSPSDPYPSYQSLLNISKNDDQNALKYEILLSLADIYILQTDMQESAFECGYRALDMARETKALAWLPDIHAKVGTLFEKVDDPETAVKHYENAIAFHSTHTTSLTRLGAIENERGNYDMAHGHITSALRVDSTHHEAWFHLGLVRQHQEKHEDAAEAFLTALELETTCPVEEFSAVRRYI